MTMITGKQNTQNARIIILRSALKLECLGMTRKGQSVYSIIKAEFGFKGSKAKVLEQLNAYILQNMGI